MNPEIEEKRRQWVEKERARDYITKTVEGTLLKYEMRSLGEWGRIIIDEPRNTIMCYTSLGNYNYSWGAPGNSFLTFLTQLNYGYAMGNFLSGEESYFDVDKTIQVMKEHIDDNLEEGSYTQEQADDMLENIEDAEGYHKDEFMGQIRDGAYGKNDHDYWERAFYGYHPRTVRFWELIWEPLMYFILAGLALGEDGKGAGEKRGSLAIPKEVLEEVNK